MFSAVFSLLKNLFEKLLYVFNGNCSTIPSNVALLLEKKKMLTRLSKFSSEFTRLKKFGLIPCVNNPAHTRVLTLRV